MFVVKFRDYRFFDLKVQSGEAEREFFTNTNRTNDTNNNIDSENIEKLERVENSIFEDDEVFLSEES